MATKKAKPAAVSKAVATRTAARAVVRSVVVVESENGNSRRLLREAAWTRMFGRADMKNPFAR
jgi:hypothetical protein